MGNDNKTEDAILKIFKHTKDSKNEPWRHKIKLGLKHRDKEDIAYGKQLSTGSLKKLKGLSKDKTRESNYITP